MTDIFVNSKPVSLPENVTTVSQLLDFMHIPTQGTGVGINSRIIPAADWNATPLKENDNVIIISAAYGG